jgi:hypothetical protein
MNKFRLNLFVFWMLVALLSACQPTVIYITATPSAGSTPIGVTPVIVTPVVITQTPLPTQVSNFERCLAEVTPSDCLINTNPELLSPYSTVNNPNGNLNQRSCKPRGYEYFFEMATAATNSNFMPARCIGGDVIWDVAFRNGSFGFSFAPNVSANVRYLLKLRGTYALIQNSDNLLPNSLQFSVFVQTSAGRLQFEEKAVEGGLAGDFEVFWLMQPRSAGTDDITIYGRIPFGVNQSTSTVTFESIELFTVPTSFGTDADVNFYR